MDAFAFLNKRTPNWKGKWSRRMSGVQAADKKQQPANKNPTQGWA
jgi:hypothetical protein